MDSGPPRRSHPGSGRQDHLFAVVLLVLEDVVAVRRLGQRQPVGDDPRGVDLTLLDALEKWLHVALHVTLSSLEGERTVQPGPGRKLVEESAVHADHRHDAAATT